MASVEIFKALSNDTRLKIVDLLKKEKSLCACKIEEKIDLTQSTISHHMKILEKCNIVNCRKEGKWHHYSLNYQTLKSVELFIKDLIQKQEENLRGGRCNCDS
jgi:ArsR family transcriptional regulator